MVYLDTSVVVPLLAMEPSSTAVLAWFNDLGELPVSSDWLLTEFASAISMKIRTGQVSVSDARAIHKDFDMLVAGNLRLVPVNRISFKNAAEISRYHDSGLRSGDDRPTRHGEVHRHRL